MTENDRMPTDTNIPIQPSQNLARRHFRIGWIALCVFVVLGTVLEGFHAFKLGTYLDVGQETRRLMWTLAHAHGIGLSLLHLGLATTVASMSLEPSRPLQFASTGTTWATILMPLGFLLGGFGALGGDPGIGVFLVPIGALLLLVSVCLTAREVVRSSRPQG